MVVGPAAQAPTNVEKEKEIVTLMPTVVAIWNVALTTVILPWDSLLIMTAVNQVRHFKAPKKNGSHQNLREIVILERWKQVPEILERWKQIPEILERWKQIPEILENVKTISRNFREIEFVEKWNQVSEILEKVTLV